MREKFIRACEIVCVLGILVSLAIGLHGMSRGGALYVDPVATAHVEPR